MNKRVSAIASALFILTTAQAQFLSNGDFEAEPLGADSAATTFSGWTEGAGSAAVNAPSAISGTHSAKLVYVTAGNLLQNLTDTNNLLSQWIFEVDFACSNPGSGTARSFNPRLAHTTAGFNQINFRVVDSDGNGVGDVQFFNGSVWAAVLPNSVTFSSSDTSLSVNHLKIVGHYSDPTPNYDVHITRAADSVTNSALAQVNFHGTKPTTGAALRVVSFETGNYPTSGGAFSVVDNVTVTNFGAINNAALITSQPTSQTLLEGAASVTFTAGISGTPPFSAQWFFNGVAIDGETNVTSTASTLTLTNITEADAGNYNFAVSNAYGGAVSSNALLTVIPVDNTAQMTNLWTLLPGERSYLAASGNTERGLAYNPITTNLLVASRAGGSNTIAVLDAATGAEKHLMDLSGVGGGSIDLNMVGVADDGVVYAANATVSASSPVYYLYRWSDDSAGGTAVQVFIGDPADPVQPNLRWGDNMAIRGAGSDTQILLAPGSGTNVVLLRTVSGLDFQTEIPPTVIAVAGVPGGFAQSAVAFGPGTNTFWAKAAGQNLRLIQFDIATGTGTVLQTYPGSAVPGIVTAIGVDKDQKFLAGLAVETPDNVRLYDISNVAADPVLRDQELFSVDNANITINGTGSAAFGGDKLFVLDSNNGIKAFLLNTNFVTVPVDFSFTGISQEGGTAVLSWPTESGHSYQLQAKDSLDAGTWSNVGEAIDGTGATVSVTNVISSAARFFRVEAQ